MASINPATQLTPRLIASLHVEAMVLSDEARSYFDGYGRAERATLDTVERVYFSCESLKVTTRLMHIVAWLLVQRARLNGEEGAGRAMRLGHADHSDPAGLIGLPAAARAIIAGSQDLYRRVAQLDEDLQGQATQTMSPARSLQQVLAGTF